MAEYIKKSDVLAYPIWHQSYDKANGNAHFISGVESVMEFVEGLPTADVAQVRRGRWTEYDGADKGFHYCSECKGQAFNYEENGEVIEVFSGWCHNCGARMDKEDDHEAG